MNLYLILEGDKTEPKVYPIWFSYFIPQYSQVYFKDDAVKNNFYIFSGGGIPSIYNHVGNAILDINDNPIYDKLIVCLDAEGASIEMRKQKLLKYLEEQEIKLVEQCELHIIVQNVCIETWFLGNRRIVKRIPETEDLISFLDHYDVTKNEPEDMDNTLDYKTKAQFHFAYFKAILAENNLRYSKTRPDIVTHKTFVDQLIKRINETGHLKSLQSFFSLLEQISKSS